MLVFFLSGDTTDRLALLAGGVRGPRWEFPLRVLADATLVVIPQTPHGDAPSCHDLTLYADSRRALLNELAAVLALRPSCWGCLDQVPLPPALCRRHRGVRTPPHVHIGLKVAFQIQKSLSVGERQTATVCKANWRPGRIDYIGPDLTLETKSM